MLGLAGKSLGWFLAAVAVSLGFLLVPLQVAAERKRLDHTLADIGRANRDIRALETEFETRASLAQLDRWNAENLKLVAPSAEQFVSSEQALAQIDVTRPGAATASGTAAQMAAFVPSAPVDPRAMMQPAVAVTAAPAVPASAAAAAPVAPKAAPDAAIAVRMAAARVAPPTRAAMASVVRASATAHRRDIALLDRALLDDSLIGDLRSGARAETSGRGQ